MQSLWYEIFVVALSRDIADIYFLPQEDGYNISFHDGQKIIKFKNIELEHAEKLMTFLKYKAQMNIAEKRRPQLGSFIEVKNDQTYWCRLSSVGDFHNLESLVIRILVKPQMQKIRWLEPAQFDRIINNLPASGLAIIAGPTGSGKTTTVHQILSLVSSEKLILSIEDPVEIQNNKILQLQVNEQADMDYFSLIKVALRHHPDILMVGEIRDVRTANAVLRAGLSGHLVLSTIHANSAKAVVERLRDLGLDIKLLRQALKTIVYQRLIMTKNGLAAIVDQLNDDEIFTNNKTSQWKEILDENLKKHNIEIEEYKKFIKMVDQTTS